MTEPLTKPSGSHRIDFGAIARGAIVDLAIFLPFVTGIAILKHNDLATQESYLWVASALAVFVAPGIGGMVAGRRQPRSPLMHGAAAAFLAALGYVCFRLIDGVVGGRSAHAGGLVLFVQLSVAMGTVGGYGGFRAQASGRSSDPEPTAYQRGRNDL